MLTTFSILVKGALRDRTSLLWGIAFPLFFLIVLGFIFHSTAYRQQLLLGMLALSVLFFSLYGVAFESLAQRNSGVYKLLRATPYRTITFVANLTCAYGVVALLSSAIVIVAGMLIFNIWLRWESILLLLPIVVLATLCFALLGLIISSLSQKEAQVNMVSNIVVLPMMFASEVFYSLSVVPTWVKIVGRLLPLSYLIEGEQAALAGNLAGLVLPLLTLGGFTVLTLLLAVATFRWDHDASLVQHILHM